MPNSLGLNKSPQETKVCVAMSGGVDSTAAACLLLQEGYQVFGLTMDLLQPPYAPAVSGIKDAGTVAAMLGIEHHYLDYKTLFSDRVVKTFIRDYLSGETPSPCILCNQHIKLGALADKARELGADIIVTGHYADIRLSDNGVELHRAADLTRDQSYFLFAVSKENLQMLRCPLAGYNKAQTRQIVRKAGLPVFQKPDSQDICFVENGKYAELIKRFSPQTSLPGKILHVDGRILGSHKGLIHYTVGQRKGLGIGGNEGILYVVGIDAAHNRIIVGPHESLGQTDVLVNNVNWLGENRPAEMELQVKLRSRQSLVPAVVRFLPENRAEVRLKDRFYGVAPGQGCCFYDGTRVLGGGFIAKNSFGN